MTDDTHGPKQRQRSGFRFWMVIPALGAAAVFSTFLIKLVDPGDRDALPSTLIDRAAPEFTLDPLYADAPGFSTADLQDPEVKLVNIWASWCVPCRVEHPKLEEIAARGITVHGINYKDNPGDARAFLDELGNPYALIGADGNGRVGIDWGVYGVPETFVVDGGGRVVYKHIGPIQNDDLETKIMPAIEAARGD